MGPAWGWIGVEKADSGRQDGEPTTVCTLMLDDKYQPQMKASLSCSHSENGRVGKYQPVQSRFLPSHRLVNCRQKTSGNG